MITPHDQNIIFTWTSKMSDFIQSYKRYIRMDYDMEMTDWSFSSLYMYIYIKLHYDCDTQMYCDFITENELL